MVYAHSRNERGERHELIAHLQGTAELAERFAAAFASEAIARYLSLWHDIGKIHPRFQQYLLICEAQPAARGHGPDHKSAGALLAAQHLGPLGLVIQGHHGGLRSLSQFQAWLERKRAEPAVQEALSAAREAFPALEPSGPLPLPAHAESAPSSAEFYLRMVFSALVDADFLDTERHFDPQRAARREREVDLADLWARFERDHRQRFADAPPTPVNRVRNEVLAACLAAAEQPPGLFRLTVPTGGGKTRAALAFGLRHALRHGLRRIVVALPYVSITEQTAQVYREIFATSDHEAPVVLEHHSMVSSPDSDEGDFHPNELWSRLASENWDAPIIVTTTVQLFESLFASATSRCRKLHRLARSVIVLDEAQALPPQLLRPILDALRELCSAYGSSVLLSTATQPAFESIPEFSTVPAHEIVPDPAPLFAALRRVQYDVRAQTALQWTEVAELARAASQALIIVNTKRDALNLLDVLDDPQALHLSTLLCGAHRSRVIADVRRRLEAGEACRLVSTQAVEAGVDLDFPLVLRALGPLDSIVQAAGRCNREGRRRLGRVLVFRPAEGGLPTGSYRIGTELAAALLTGAALDPDAPTTLRSYFRQLYASVPTDREGIQALRERLDYPEVARRFRLIDDDQQAVAITRYGSPEERQLVGRLLDQLRRRQISPRLALRQLQPYLVNLRAHQAQRYERQGLIAPVLPGLGEWLGDYDPVRGLTGGDLPADDLII